MTKPVRFLTPSPVAPIEPVVCTEQQIRTAHMLIAAWLTYPEERFDPALAAYDEVRDALPAGIRVHLDAFVDWAVIRPAYDAWLRPGNFDAAGIQKTPLEVRP